MGEERAEPDVIELGRGWLMLEQLKEQLGMRNLPANKGPGKDMDPKRLLPIRPLLIELIFVIVLHEIQQLPIRTMSLEDTLVGKHEEGASRVGAGQVEEEFHRGILVADVKAAVSFNEPNQIGVEEVCLVRDDSFVAKSDRIKSVPAQEEGGQVEGTSVDHGLVPPALQPGISSEINISYRASSHDSNVKLGDRRIPWRVLREAPAGNGDRDLSVTFGGDASSRVGNLLGPPFNVQNNVIVAVYNGFSVEPSGSKDGPADVNGGNWRGGLTPDLT